MRSTNITSLYKQRARSASNTTDKQCSRSHDTFVVALLKIAGMTRSSTTRLAMWWLERAIWIISLAQSAAMSLMSVR